MSLVARFVDKFAGTIGWRSEPRHYGRIKDNHDPRDYKYVPSPEVLKSLGKDVDLRAGAGPIYNQGSLGSCTANCWLSLFMFVHNKQFGEFFKGSRLQVYYDERKILGTVDKDSGANMRDGAKCLAATGVCPETIWPYDISTFTQEPNSGCYAEAAKHKIVEYRSLEQDLDHMKACLQEGYPFIFGFNVPQSFESVSVMRTGIFPMPNAGEKIVGGHCMEVVGFVDQDGQIKMSTPGLFGGFAHFLRLITGARSFGVQPPKNSFICKNSWGEDWGDGGYCYVPYQFITDSKWSEDLWTVRTVTTAPTA